MTRRRWIQSLLGVVAAGGLAWGLAMAFTWPVVGELARRNPGTTAFIERYRATQRERWARDTVAWTWVPLGRISPHLQRAVIVAEDIGFFFHRGFDLGEMRQALRDAVVEGEAPRGASTLSQQLVKNLWLSPSRNPLRKVKEALLTWQLERALPKRRILELYLNVAEFGPGTYGAEAAAQRYFGRPADQLDERQAALLAAGLSRPSRWNPASTSPAYAAQVARIESRMGRAEFLWRRLGVDRAAGAPDSMDPDAPPGLEGATHLPDSSPAARSGEPAEAGPPAQADST